jgi:hypothetical protein
MKKNFIYAAFILGIMGVTVATSKTAKAYGGEGELCSINSCHSGGVYCCTNSFGVLIYKPTAY